MVFNVDESALVTVIILILYYYFLNLKNNSIESTLSCWWWEYKVIGQMLQNIISGRETSCQLFHTQENAQCKYFLAACQELRIYYKKKIF